MSTTSWAGKDANGNPINFNAEQPNPGGPLTPHFVLEINGSPVAGDLSVQDAAAEASLATIAANGATAANQETAIASLATIASNSSSGVGGAGISQPAGGTGIQGWLSGIFKALTGTLTTVLAAGTNAIGTVGVTALSALTAGTAAIGSVNQTPTALTNSVAGNVTNVVAIIVPFSATRKWVTVFNRSTGTETHDLGSSNVAVLGGIPVAPGGGDSRSAAPAPPARFTALPPLLRPHFPMLRPDS